MNKLENTPLPIPSYTRMQVLKNHQWYTRMWQRDRTVQINEMRLRECICTPTRVRIYLYMHTYTQTHTYTYSYICTCTHARIHAHTYTYACICTPLRRQKISATTPQRLKQCYRRTYVSIYICMHIHIYMHIHICIRKLRLYIYVV